MFLFSSSSDDGVPGVEGSEEPLAVAPAALLTAATAERSWAFLSLFFLDRTPPLAEPVGEGGLVVWADGAADPTSWTRRRAVKISSSVKRPKGSRLLRMVPLNNVGSGGSS